MTAPATATERARAGTRAETRTLFDIATASGE
jgi:hypothetical protein